MTAPLSKLVKYCVFSAAFLSVSSIASEANVKSAIERALPQYSIESITVHEGTGLYDVKLASGPSLYVSANGQYFVAGDLYRIDGIDVVNETEMVKMAQVEAWPANEMIVFAAKGEEKAHVTVFTDVDCGYCRMLHKEVPTLNDMGITVRYMAYPRAGLGSDVYQKMQSIWCAANPQDAMTQAKLGRNVPENSCDNPIARQYNLGNSVGVRGTPSLVLDNGRFIPGYMPAAELAKALGL